MWGVSESRAGRMTGRNMSSPLPEILSQDQLKPVGRPLLVGVPSSVHFPSLTIMSGRVPKSRSSKSIQRSALACRISERGFDAEMPCTACFRGKRVCRMSDESSRCLECVRRGRSCDGITVGSSCSFCWFLVLAFLLTVSVNRASKEQKKIEKQIEESEEVLQEALARLSRLRRQRDVLRKKTSELFARGMRELDEEDGVRSQEEAILQEQQAVGEAQSTAHLDVLDWTSILGEPDLFGGTVATAGDNL